MPGYLLERQNDHRKLPRSPQGKLGYLTEAQKDQPKLPRCLLKAPGYLLEVPKVRQKPLKPTGKPTRSAEQPGETIELLTGNAGLPTVSGFQTNLLNLT